MDVPHYNDSDGLKRNIYKEAVKNQKFPFWIIPTIDDVKYKGDFDFIVMAQSPNYTPASADFIIDIIREYIDEC